MPGCIDSPSMPASTRRAAEDDGPSRSSSPSSTRRPISDMSGALADRDQVDEVLRHLDERTRAVVVLHYFLGLPLTEVAATLGIPVGTVKSRLHRALGEMRVAIAAEPTPTPSPVVREGSSHDDRTSPRARPPARSSGDLAMGPYPDYIDDVLATTAQRRQRPAWTFPERWLPMVDVARQPVLAPRLPWRAISLALADDRPAARGRRRVHRLADRSFRRRSAARATASSPMRRTAISTPPIPSTGSRPRSSPVPRPTSVRASRATARTSSSSESSRATAALRQLYVARSDGTDPTLITPEPVLLTQEPARRSVGAVPVLARRPVGVIAAADGGFPRS